MDLVFNDGRCDWMNPVSVNYCFESWIRMMAQVTGGSAEVLVKFRVQEITSKKGLWKTLKYNSLRLMWVISLGKIPYICIFFKIKCSYIFRWYSLLMKVWQVLYLGGGFKYFLLSPLIWEMIQFDSYFSDRLKPLTSHYLIQNPTWTSSNSHLLIDFWADFIGFTYLDGPIYPKTKRR